MVRWKNKTKQKNVLCLFGDQLFSKFVFLRKHEAEKASELECHRLYLISDEDR